MPKATKDAKKDELKEEKKTTQKLQTNKTSSTKKSTSTTKKSTSTTKRTSTKKSTTSIKKDSTSKRKTTSKEKKVDTPIIAEYYDLPYRYNETIVKILYQTPTILFVYWDISDEDRTKFITQYGQNFFNETKPILKIYNLSKNYSFEVEINDFANSWYIDINDANCNYKVELARKKIDYNSNINSDYIYISSSNNIEFPNDHILLEELPDTITFKNVKTNGVTSKKIGSLQLIGINNIYSVNNFYKKLYKDEILDELNNKKIINPSSSSW